MKNIFLFIILFCHAFLGAAQSISDTTHLVGIRVSNADGNRAYYSDADNVLRPLYPHPTSTGGGGNVAEMVTNVALAGTNLNFTGQLGAFNGSVDLSSLQDGIGTDNQTLSLSGNTLSISGGNSITLPSGGTTQNLFESIGISDTYVGGVISSNTTLTAGSPTDQFNFSPKNSKITVEALPSQNRILIGLGSIEINDLVDVNVAVPSVNEVLTWNGSNWTNQAITDQHFLNANLTGSSNRTHSNNGSFLFDINSGFYRTRVNTGGSQSDLLLTSAISELEHTNSDGSDHEIFAYSGGIQLNSISSTATGNNSASIRINNGANPSITTSLFATNKLSIYRKGTTFNYNLNDIPSYASDAAANADTDLDANSIYKVGNELRIK